MEGGDGKWKLRKLANYKDRDGKYFDFPPPNHSIQSFIDNEISSLHPRGGYDNTLPSWVKVVQDSVLIDRMDVDLPNRQPLTPLLPPNKSKQKSSSISTPSSATPLPSPNKARRLAASTPSSTTTPRPPRKRQSPEQAVLEEKDDALRLKEAELASALERIKELLQIHESDQDAIHALKEKLQEQEDLSSRLENKLKQLQEVKAVLTYDDLRPGGRLADYVKDFTYFCDFETNDEFLDVLNYADHSEEAKEMGGLCEHLARYSKVSMEKRKQHNDQLRETLASLSGDEFEDGNESDNSSEGNPIPLSTDNTPHKRSGRKRKLHWKTEYLVYCFYAKCNISMRRTAALFGIKQTLVHNIVYGWANFLSDALSKLFPVPTRSQMLSTYPVSHIRKLGHAKTFMLLDATEIFAEVASMKTVNAILYSHYKHSSTIKWLVGCDPIGTTWDDSISNGYPGAISDPVQTSVTSILDQKDVASTQKVGKTRIPVEQINGQMKCSTAFFDRRIRIDQIGLADLICRVSYLMQNFRLPFIQQRNSDNDPPEGRPCKAEIRWYGGTDDGLVDIRPHVEFWGCDSEIACWHELRNDEDNTMLSDLDISLLVLDEDWPKKLRKEHRAELGIED